MIEYNYIENDELPYRIIIDGYIHGAGITEKDAIMTALRVGQFIPKDCTRPNKAKSYLFWNYEVSSDWAELIKRLS